MPLFTVKRRCVFVPVVSSDSTTKKSEGGSISVTAGEPTVSPGRRYTPTEFQLSESAPVGARYALSPLSWSKPGAVRSASK